MSKICENCGNMIPDGSAVCPGCGREQYNDDALQSVLSELSFALDHIQDEAEPAAPQKEQQVDGGETIVFSTDEVKKETQSSAPSAVAEAMGAANRRSEAQAQKVKPETQKKQTASGKNGKKKRKKKKASSSTVLGIVIGLILALLVVAGAAFFMLYKLGFFELLSDDQLLTTTSSAVEETLSTAETTESIVSEAPVEEPAEVPSVVEESIVEEAPVEEEIPEEADSELSAVEEPVEEETVNVKKFTLTGADDMTFVSRGETAEIVYVISPEDAQWDIEWESSDETVATVSDFGVITARRGGECVVTGTCGEFEVSVNVRCSFTVPTTVLDMNYEDITMDHEGQEVQMKIDYDLTADQIKNTVWESTDESVATVDEDGLVTAIADGTAVISASIGNYTASCIVRCVNVTGNKGVNSEDSEYVINYEDVTLTRKGEYFELTLKSILGKDVPSFTWKSSDSDIATVDDKGVVTAVSDGTCKITTSIGEDDFECIVRVRISG